MRFIRQVLMVVGLLGIVTGPARLSHAAPSGPPYAFRVIEVQGAGNTYANGINNLGEVVGSYAESDGVRVHGFLRQRKGFTVLDYPGAGITDAFGINDLGVIVGTYLEEGPPYGTTHAFRYEASDFMSIDVTLPDVFQTVAFGINNSGVIVGFTDGPEADDFWGYIRDGRDVTRMMFPEADSSFLYRINDAGTVVGTYFIGGLLYKAGSFTVFQFPHGSYGFATGLNNLDQIVGQWYDTEAENRLHGFIHHQGHTEEIDVPGAVQTAVADINDAGQIVGWFEDADGLRRAFIGTPLCKGDLDGDGDIDGEDLAGLRSELGRTDCGQAVPCECDMAGDGMVNDIDLRVFSAVFGAIE